MSIASDGQFSNGDRENSSIREEMIRMRNLRQNVCALLATTVLLALASSCGGSKETATAPSEQAPAAEGAAWKPTGNEGSITGKIVFKGAVPKVRAISMDADAVCASKHQGAVYPESVVANTNGTLRNVFVYVKIGPGRARTSRFPTSP